MSGTETPVSSSTEGSSDEMRLRVETICGALYQLSVSKYETVLSLKNRIFNKQGIPVAEQNLMFLNEELQDFKTLDEYNIKNNCTLKLCVGMKGGPINTRRTLYLDDKNTIHEMAKMLAANDVSVVLVPHNGAYHVIPVPSEKRSGTAQAGSSAERRGSNSSRGGALSSKLLMENQEGRRSEENKATKCKMTALQKQFKKKRSAPGAQGASPLPVISRQSMSCNLQKTILTDAMPPAASASPVALVAGGGGEGGSSGEPSRKMVVPRLITSTTTVNELNSAAQNSVMYYSATMADGGFGGGGRAAYESSSSYGGSGVERNLVIYPSGGGGASPSAGGRETIFAVSPYKGLFRCTADTTENASKEDVSSNGSGRCSSAAAAPPPQTSDSSPTVVDRPSSTPSGSTSGPPVGLSRTTSTANNTTPPGTSPTPAVCSTQSHSSKVDELTAPKDEVKVERKCTEQTDCTPVPQVEVIEPKDSSPLAPPKKKHPRCAVCQKKTGLASSYSCRCGGNFCATHRYAEAHECNHDYKGEGRQQLEKSNPLIQAAKLHKI